MIYREFGKTGKKVSVLGMGCSRFLPEQYKTSEGMQRCADLIVKAWENGVNYFDTAPSYCDWKSEEIVGIAMKRIKGKAFISCKSSSTMDVTADALRRRLDTSLKKMNVSKITFYNMWGILNYEQYLDVIKTGGPYEGALAAKKEGLIEHICFSAHCTGAEIERILEDDLFEGITIGYNAINFKFREQGLAAAKRKGIGVATMNPLYGGVIPANGNRFDFIRNNRKQTLAQSALLFNASHEEISVVLSGIANAHDLQENLLAFEENNIFSSDKIADIKEKIQTEFDSLCTGCNYCTGCPEGLKVNQLMLAYNQILLTGEREEGKKTDFVVQEFRKYMYDVWRYGAETVFNCRKCGYCAKKCTQHLPIIERIEEINQLAEKYLKENIKPSLMKSFQNVKGKKIGIYASGPYAKRALDLYMRLIEEIDFELYFFDSNEKKWGKESVLSGYIVNPPDKIGELGIEKILIASSAFYSEIYNSLENIRDLGIEVSGIEL